MSGADGGGLLVGGPSFSVVNTWIVKSGKGGAGGSDFGGVRILAADGNSRFQHNTVADNQQRDDSLAGGGVDCALAFEIFATIVFGNDETDVVGCAARASNIEGGAALGPDNIDADPQFIDPGAPSNFHLDPASPCIDAAVGSAEPRDIDGELRSGARDIGADEVQ